MKKAPTWLRITAAVVVIVSGALSMYANYLTVKQYNEQKAKTA